LIAAHLSTCLTALLSAFFPLTPVEPYLVGLAAATGYGPVGLGIAAAVGQTIGKTAIFLGARGVLRSERVRRLAAVAVGHGGRDGDAEPDRPAEFPGRVRGLGGPTRAAAARLTALLERPALTVPILFLSATTGLPPLLATSVCIAGTRVSVPLFAGVCLVGRSVRFIALAYAPQLLLG
jgi:membrane protein YqaA with SNARE-associated domain